MVSREEFIKESLRSDAKLRRDLYTDELNRYLELYQKTTDRCRLFQEDLKNIHNLPSVTTPQFLNKVIIAVLGHLTQTHTVICSVDRDSGYGSRYKKEFLATGEGIRIRSGYSSRSRDLNGSDIIEIFTKHSKEIEDWFAKEKPKKLADWQLLKTAFLNGYQDGFCSKYDPYSGRGEQSKMKFFDFTKKVNKPVVILNESKYGGYEVKSAPFNVSRIIARYSIEANLFRIYLIDDSKNIMDDGDKNIVGDGCVQFEFNDSLKFMEARDLLPDIVSVVNDADANMKLRTKEMRAWFDGFKLAMNKYVSIMGL